MSEVKRYDVLGDYDGGYIDEAKDGRVVLYTDYSALEAECKRLRSSVEGLKDTLAGAKAWMEDVTNVVLYPLAMDGADKIALEAEGFGSCTPELFNSIDAALSAKP